MSTANIKKAFSKTKWLLKDFFIIWKHFSFYYAGINLCWWLSYYHRNEGKGVSFFWKKKHLYIVAYLKKNCPETWKWLEDNRNTRFECSPVDKFRVWVFWYQGMESAPELVKACYRQLCRNCGDAVTLITKDNLQEYVSFPEVILQKVKEKRISLTHFSDILRVSLLAQHGGLWIDATCWTSSAFPEWIRKSMFYSCKLNNESLWRGWLMGSGYKGYPLFVLIQKALFEYWENNDFLIDYLLIDHILKIAFDEVSQVHQDMLDLPPNNENRSVLYICLARQWNPEDYQQICNGSWCFKLSWKTKFPVKTDSGDLTFFGWMLQESEKDISHE